jgi:hypothetical protein
VLIISRDDEVVVIIMADIVITPSGEEAAPVNTITIGDALKITYSIAEKARLFWAKNSKLRTMDEVNAATTRLYNSLKIDHEVYARSYPLLMMALARGIFDDDCVRVYFNDILVKKGLGTDEDQIERAARYMAFASGAIQRKAGNRVKDSDIRKNKREIIKVMTAERLKMKEAMAAVKGDRDGSRGSTQSSREESSSDDTLESLQNQLLESLL